MKDYDNFEALCALLEIESVKGEPTFNAPFGENVKKALEFTLNLAKSLGFETKNYDNYIGEVYYGEGEPFGILCHLDVVPVGNLSAWNTPPFKPTVVGGNLYARGVLDDKCGAICSLYALKKLKDEGIMPNRKITLILGCDEESGWGCIDYYKAHAVLPKEGISPDADFPVIYAEKGILHIKYELAMKKPFYLTGGTRGNVVCDLATISGATINEKLISALGLKVEGGNITSYGIAAHGSTPEKGVNALKNAIKYLAEEGYLDSAVYENFFEDKLALSALKDETSKLTFSPNIAETVGDKLYITVDVRYPSTYQYDYISARLKEVADYEIVHYQPPLFVDKNSFLVQSLLSVYNEVTGENAQPIAIGGGTYARALSCGVAFGPSFGAEGDTVHQPNEYMPVENIEKLTTILYKALIKICC